MSSTAQGMSDGQQSLAAFGGLSVGNRVVDDHNHPVEDAEEFGPMRVIDADVGQAGEIKVEGTPLSEWPNNDCAPDETVVTVAYESHLESYVPGWQDNINRLQAMIQEYQDEFGVDVDTYQFPRSRLQEVPDPLGD